MKKIMVLVLIAAVAILNLVLLGLNFWLAMVLVIGALALAAFADVAGEKKSPKRTITMSQAARHQRDLARA